GSSVMETPAMPLDMGSCLTVASRAELPPRTFPSDSSRSNRKVGSSLPSSKGSGLLMAPISARPSEEMADRPATALIVPRNFRLVGSNIAQYLPSGDVNSRSSDRVPISDRRWQGAGMPRNQLLFYVGAVPGKGIDRL